MAAAHGAAKVNAAAQNVRGHNNWRRDLMTTILLILGGEVVIALGLNWFRVHLDPSRAYEKRKGFWLQVGGVMALTFLIWFYWHPISQFADSVANRIEGMRRP